MNAVDFGVGFSLGLISSLHCVQMCGPIVLSYSVAVESLTQNGSRPAASSLLGNHLAYNTGRILTYTALGAAAGFAGHTLGLLGRFAGLGHTVMIAAGAAMIVLSVFLLGLVPARLQSVLRIPQSFLKRAGGLISAPGLKKRFFLGLSLGFLPCGLIYAALLKAMATGSLADGAFTMVAFGLGTASSLLAIGLFSSAIRMRFNRWGSQLAAVSVMVMGIVLIWRGAMPGIMPHDHLHAHH